MGKVIIGMTISLDGYVNDRDGSVASLYPDIQTLRETQPLQESIRNTGAVIMGKRTFAMGDPDWYADNYEYQVPIFVLTHQPPPQHPRETDRLRFTFVQDGLENTLAQAKVAANGKDVTIVGGVNTFQQCLRLKLADEIHIDIMPIVLGAGLRLFDTMNDGPIVLEKIKTFAGPARTSLCFRVI